MQYYDIIDYVTSVKFFRAIRARRSAMLGLNLGLTPAMPHVKLPPELSVEEVRNLLRRWMERNVAEIGHVREISHDMNGWENPVVQGNLSSGWTNSPNEDVINLVGVIPVIVYDDGNTLDLIVYRFKLGTNPWELRFWWDGNQRSVEGVRSNTNLQQVVDAFGRMYQLLDS